MSHEGLGATPDGQPRLDALVQTMRVKLVVHGHLHRDIDDRQERRRGEDSPFLTYGVDQDSHLRWPPRSDAQAPGIGLRPAMICPS